MLRGRGFDLIPDDAVGTISAHNDDPLESRNSSTPTQIFEITAKSDTEMVISQATAASHRVPTYVGAILSKDRNIVFWENDTAPLP